MDANDRLIVESPLFQGEDERIAYRLNTTPWGTSPASPSDVLYDASGTDVSGTNLTGAASVSGVYITTRQVISLTDGQQYRLEIQWTDSGNTFESWVDIYAQE